MNRCSLMKLFLAPAGLACGVLLAGCDLSGEYERRYEQTLVASNERAVFDQNLYAAETEVLGEGGAASGVKLRIPLLFDNNSKSLPATEPRAQPPFVKIPGLNYALERPLEGNVPAYIYFGAIPKGEQKPDQVQAPLAAAVAAAFPGAAWADASFRTPQGANLSHKVLRGTGVQDFDGTASGGTAQKLDGKFELYFIESPTHYAFVGFRMPTAQAPQSDAAIAAAMGTVTVASASSPPAEAPAGNAPAGNAPAAATPAGTTPAATAPAGT